MGNSTEKIRCPNCDLLIETRIRHNVTKGTKKMLQSVVAYPSKNLVGAIAWNLSTLARIVRGEILTLPEDQIFTIRIAQGMDVRLEGMNSGQIGLIASRMYPNWSAAKLEKTLRISNVRARDITEMFCKQKLLFKPYHTRHRFTGKGEALMNIFKHLPSTLPRREDIL